MVSNSELTHQTSSSFSHTFLPFKARRTLILSAAAIFLVLTCLSFFSFRSIESLPKPLSHEPIPPRPSPPVIDNPAEDYFDWASYSEFNPVRQDVANKSIEELCCSFPSHLLQYIQPVLKTGHAVLKNRLGPQLDGLSACLGDTLLIVSDVDEEFQGHQVIDVIADLREEFKQTTPRLEVYHQQKALAEAAAAAASSHHPASSAPATITPADGWMLDVFKFLPQVSRAWRQRPDRRWYVFYEDDTYIVWDNLFRLLEHYDPDVPLYLGSPTPGVFGTWFANGGPGYVLSRAAVRRLVADDFDPATGVGRDGGGGAGSALAARWEHVMRDECCGDSLLDWVLHVDAHTDLTGLFPMFNPHPLHNVPFSDEHWCQPVISMHRMYPEDMVGLARWEETRRQARRPLLYKDLAEYLDFTAAVREDWHNSDWGGYPAPLDGDAHSSFEACGRACKADERCFQWTYHLQSCEFVPAFRLGQVRSPSADGWRLDEGRDEWTHQEMRFMAGWDLDGIKKWKEGKDRQCDVVKWVKPSLTRVF